MKWNPCNPLELYPPEVQASFQREAQLLLGELQSNKLEVILIPAPEQRFSGHKIRVAVNHNPPWYSQIYQQVPHIKRERVERCLQRLTESQDGRYRRRPYRYDFRFREIIFERLIDGYEDSDPLCGPFCIEANQEIRDYFELKTFFPGYDDKTFDDEFYSF